MNTNNRVRKRNTTNIHSELKTIESHIEYFNNAEYKPCICESSRALYPFSGLDEEDFYYIKDALIKMLNECYNKKAQELIDFLSNSKK